MPRPRFFRLDPERQSEILDVAAEHFAASGYEGASLNQIIVDIGISKGAFYYLFDDKEDLLLAVVDHAWEVFVPALVDLEELDASSFWPALARMMQEARETVRAKPWLIGVTRLIYKPPASTAAAELVAQRLAEMRRWQAALVHRGQGLGVVRDDLPAGLLLALLVGADEAADRWLVEHWDELSKADTDRIANEVFEVLHRMLASPDVKGREGS